MRCVNHCPPKSVSCASSSTSTAHPPLQALVLRHNTKTGRLALSTKALESERGLMLRAPDAVFAGAAVQGALHRARVRYTQGAAALAPPACDGGDQGDANSASHGLAALAADAGAAAELRLRTNFMATAARTGALIDEETQHHGSSDVHDASAQLREGAGSGRSGPDVAVLKVAEAAEARGSGELSKQASRSIAVRNTFMQARNALRSSVRTRDVCSGCGLALSLAPE